MRNKRKNYPPVSKRYAKRHQIAVAANVYILGVLDVVATVGMTSMTQAAAEAACRRLVLAMAAGV